MRRDMRLIIQFKHHQVPRDPCRYALQFESLGGLKGHQAFRQAGWARGGFDRGDFAGLVGDLPALSVSIMLGDWIHFPG